MRRGYWSHEGVKEHLKLRVQPVQRPCAWNVSERSRDQEHCHLSTEMKPCPIKWTSRGKVQARCLESHSQTDRDRRGAGRVRGRLGNPPVCPKAWQEAGSLGLALRWAGRTQSRQAGAQCPREWPAGPQGGVRQPARVRRKGARPFASIWPGSCLGQTHGAGGEGTGQADQTKTQIPAPQRRKEVTAAPGAGGGTGCRKSRWAQGRWPCRPQAADPN